MTKLLLVAAAALIDGDNKVLLAKRPEGKPMAGLWEFPGGKLEDGETPEAALVRELSEELGIKVNETDLTPLTFVSHAYPDFHLFMPLYELKHWIGALAPKEGQQLEWVSRNKLLEYPSPAADIPLFRILETG